MAKRDADGAVKKPYSSKLMQLKFMQRGAKAAPAPAASQDGDAEVRDEGWSANRGPEAGCRVIVEGDPQPAGLSGRLSFQNFNPATEKLQRERELEQQAAQNPGGKSVSDEDMAAALAQERRKRQKLDEGSSPQRPQQTPQPQAQPPMPMGKHSPGKQQAGGKAERRGKANNSRRYFAAQ